MEEIIKEALAQVPALALMAWLVVYFLRHLDRMAQRHHERNNIMTNEARMGLEKLHTETREEMQGMHQETREELKAVNTETRETIEKTRETVEKNTEVLTTTNILLRQIGKKIE